MKKHKELTVWRLVRVEAHSFSNLHRINVHNCNVDASARVIYIRLKHTETVQSTQHAFYINKRNVESIHL